MICGSGVHTSNASLIMNSGLIVLNSVHSEDHACSYPASPVMKLVGDADFKTTFYALKNVHFILRRKGIGNKQKVCEQLNELASVYSWVELFAVSPILLALFRALS